MECWPPARRGLVEPTARREYWSNGVLGLKVEIGLIFTFLPLVMRDPNMVYIFPYINRLSIHDSITPILQVRLTSSFDKERMTAVYQRR